uniref:Uncharacterized protein n=1 Tax=Arundo donax TaxID=35708 RepID=A0A0A9A136_ARUDO
MNDATYVHLVCRTLGVLVTRRQGCAPFDLV